jgi:hypothetical protein
LTPNYNPDDNIVQRIMKKSFSAKLIAALWLLPAAGFSFEPGQVYFPLQLPNSAANYAGTWAISLDIEYIAIESKPGILNLAEPNHPEPKPGEVLLIRDRARIRKIMELAQIFRGDQLILLCASGLQARVRIGSLAYYKSSQDSILTLAFLKPDGEARIKNEKWVLAWKKTGQAGKPEKMDLLPIDRLPVSGCGEMAQNCLSPFQQEALAEQSCFRIEQGDSSILITSFWHRPAGQSDIEEYKTEACATETRPQGKLIRVPEGIFPRDAFTASESRGFFVIGYGGTAAEVCHYLLKYDSDRFDIIKQGLCTGY